MYNLYIRWNFKIIKPSWMCDLTNTIKPPFLSVMFSLYGKWKPIKTNWLLGKCSSNFVSTIYKISTFLSTMLSTSPNLFLIELIFRHKKINLLRCECHKRFKVKLIFSSYSGLVVDASIKEPPFICSTCLVLYHTFFKALIILFAEILFPGLCKCR